MDAVAEQRPVLTWSNQMAARGVGRTVAVETAEIPFELTDRFERVYIIEQLRGELCGFEE